MLDGRNSHNLTLLLLGVKAREIRWKKYKGKINKLYDVKYSYLIQIICTWLYIKYSYLIQIICTQLYGFKYSYLILLWFRNA